MFTSGLLANNTSTTDESAIVETSPRSWSFLAILRRTRRMIFPERVFGRPGALWTISGAANGPIFDLTGRIKKIKDKSCHNLRPKLKSKNVSTEI